jgi:hypothetical protein
MSITHILFQGASVTHQDHESSYIYQLINICKKKANFFRVRKRSYGGCHINDAGFLNIYSDTKSKTDFCFLEWNTTNLNNFDMNKLLYIIGILFKKKIIPIFLILATKSNIKNNRICENQIKNLCFKFNLMFLDYRLIINPKYDLKKDGIHTNKKGAIKYAKQLFKDLLVVKKNLNNNFTFTKFNFFNYEIYPLKKLITQSFLLYQGNSYKIKFKNIKKKAEVFAYINKGPSSPIIIVKDKKKSKEICIWDKWSYYNRGTFIKLWNFINKNSVLKITVLNKKIDYSICKKKFFYVGKKYFNIINLYGVNCRPIDISKN